MRIVRLFWAGVQLECQDSTLVIDLLENTTPLRSWMGDPLLPVVFGPKALDLALVTHLHPDHYDPEALRNKLRPEAKVICDPANVPTIRRDNFDAVGALLYEAISVGPFTITALPAVDGLGDPQISFRIEMSSINIMHFGDTLWHGNWWKIRSRCGRPDVAFLPINGATIRFPGMKPSGIPADLTPEQAASAAAILEAGAACPIHYGAFHNPPIYAESSNAEGIFLSTLDRLGVAGKVVEAGNELRLPQSGAV